MKNREEIPVLVAEIEAELVKLEALGRKLSAQSGTLSCDDAVESAALRLHNLYTGCERIFRRVAGDVNGTFPESEDWHKRLLSQMALDVEEYRPAVISAETCTDLAELLGFRHVVRNVYGFELKPARVEQLIALAVSVLPRFTGEVRGFLGFLRRLYRET